jgi:branched-subunit amino acid transport protein AzlD
MPMPFEQKTVIYVLAMAAAIFLCRVFPFIFFRGLDKGDKPAARFLLFIERTAPPAAMTVLCFNALAAPIKENPTSALPVLAASLITALLHIWRRSPLLSIAGGTAIFMLIQRLGS